MLRHVSHSFSTANLAHDSLGRKRWLPSKRILADERYYLPYLGFRAIGEWFDSLGNLLAISRAWRRRSRRMPFSASSSATASPICRYALSIRRSSGRSGLARILRRTEPAASLPQRRRLAVHRRILCGRAGRGRTI